MQRHITLRQFRYFLAVCEASSVAAAARMVNIAQSAVTKSVQESLGVRLFERTPRGMVLTQEGYRFQASARKVIAAVAEASEVSRGKVETLTGNLTIGATSLVAGYYLADLFARFQRSHPSVNVSVIEDTPQFLEHLLINGEVDIAIMVSNALGDPQALVVEEMTSSTNRVWVASGHPLADRPELSLVECANHMQVVLEADRIESVLQALWARQGLHPQRRRCRWVAHPGAAAHAVLPPLSAAGVARPPVHRQAAAVPRRRARTPREHDLVPRRYLGLGDLAVGRRPDVTDALR